MATKRYAKDAPQFGSGAAVTPDRLYQRLARRLFDDLAAGRYEVGDRLPAERELAADHNVSRPAVREAMIALEVQGLVEVRIGSGAYVKRLPGRDDHQGFHATAFELTEARMLIEGEAAGIAVGIVAEFLLLHIAADRGELQRYRRP
jgi:DNA-binding FadR family transcriptional regulator